MAAFDVSPKPLPFKEAVDAFSSKLPLSPEQFARLGDEAKTRAFTVAGIALEDLIAEVFRGITWALEEGQPYEEFQRALHKKLKKAWGGERPYKLETIFQTNIQSAYQAGHYKQMTDPDVVAMRPYWMYDAVGDDRTRPAHQALDGKVVAAGDPFWDTHFPPNGFNCRCGVVTLSQRQVNERGLKVQSHEEAAKLAKTFRPDRGFDVNPGKTAFGRTLAEAEVERLRAEHPKGYLDNVEPYGSLPDAVALGRPRKLPALPTEIRPFPRHLKPGTKEVETPLNELRERFHKILGGPEVTIRDAAGSNVVVGDYLFDHLTWDGRERYLPFVPDLLRAPQEIWLQPRKGAVTGKVVLRRNYVKTYQLETDRLVTLVADVQRGVWVAYTEFGETNRTSLKVRQGLLLYPRPPT